MRPSVGPSVKHGSLLLTCVLALSVAVPGQTPLPQGPSDQEQALFAQAMQLYQAGDIEGAISAYLAFLEKRPASAEARINLGAAYARLARHEEAIAQYKRALEIDDRSTAARFNLAVAYYKAAMIPEAVTTLDGLIALQPANHNAILLLADCHLRLGDYSKVIALLSPLEATQGNNLTLLYLLGTALIRDKQLAKGQLLVDRILRDGDSAEARLMLGVAQLEARDNRGAREQFARALELNPRLPTAHSLYGRALVATGNLDRAQEVFRRELELNPNDFDANFLLGALLRREHRFDEALGYLRRALQVRPRAPEARYQLGGLYLARGNFDAARRVLEEVVKDTPHFVEAHVSLATVYYRLKRKQDGDRHREIVRKLNEEVQARAPGAREGPGTEYRGEGLPPIETPAEPPQ